MRGHVNQYMLKNYLTVLHINLTLHSLFAQWAVTLFSNNYLTLGFYLASWAEAL